jgi:hypothetical protein
VLCSATARHNDAHSEAAVETILVSSFDGTMIRLYLPTIRVHALMTAPAKREVLYMDAFVVYAVVPLLMHCKY